MEAVVDDQNERPVVIPVAEEQIRVEKREVTTGGVRVHKRVRVEPVRLEEDLREEQVEIERVPIGRFVDRPPEPYADGDTWVIPVVEEVLVLERRLRLREEVRIVRTASIRHETLDEERRVEEIELERLPPDRR